MTAAKLKQLAVAAKIDAKTQLRLGTDGPWIAAERVKGLFPASTTEDLRAKSTNSEQVRSDEGLATPDEQTNQHESSHGRSGPAHPYQAPHPIDQSGTEDASTRDMDSKRSLEVALRTIWLKPRQTIRWLIAERPGRDAIVLAMLTGGVRVIDDSILTNRYSLIDGRLILAPIVVPICAVIGVLVLFVFGFTHTIVGGAFGGQGDHRSLRTAFAWSLVPSIFSLPMSLLLLLAIMLLPSIGSLPDWLLNLPFAVLFLWGLVIEIGGISAAHEFSIWRALVTFVVSLILLTLALLIVVQAAVMLTI